MEPIKIIECPRDAMQGIKPFIPTERKVAYIQSLLRVVDSIDFGSFVSQKRFRKCRIPLLCLAIRFVANKSKLLAIANDEAAHENDKRHRQLSITVWRMVC
jgi:hydroxymethylglutaryl-CoA lyase